MTEKDRQLKTLAVLDEGSWQHSWHLPKTHFGLVDWESPETRRVVREVLEGRLERGVHMSHTALELLKEWKES